MAGSARYSPSQIATIRHWPILLLLGTFGQKNDGAEVNGGPGFMIGYNWAKDYDLPIRTELQVDYRVRHDADSRLFVNPAQSFDYDLNIGLARCHDQCPLRLRDRFLVAALCRSWRGVVTP